MASNSMGNIFRITTWGESHGPAIGVVIDGCPAGLLLQEEDINQALALRAPGHSIYTSPRQESDRCQILSGVFDGKTTGTPISIFIRNRDVDSSKYEPIQNLLRPGHANFTYLEKYGLFDYRGGGRSSARETACRVAAGAVAKKLLKHYDIQVIAYLLQVANIAAKVSFSSDLFDNVYKSPIYCPDAEAAKSMQKAIMQAKEEGDSLGGIVELSAQNLPVGLGDPMYEKLEANLAKAMMSLPATKGFEIGTGFQAVKMPGSIHNDSFQYHQEKITTATNHAGGTLGGISTGMPLIARVVFKPPSSVMKEMATVNRQGEAATFKLPAGSRHDPCVAIRAVPVVEAMAALVLADALLMNRLSRLE
ncbi:chorismate synthase [Neochlamydia sp. EPS4]|uniref:chorismate synthase n=1 Tax=Neochlamydia sp. EPS4 TaxID=1478175 RepID=UPI0005D103C5|nr:chorismate synthase [Neochlamydia sp. EPS4]